VTNTPCAYTACENSGEYENHRYEMMCRKHYLFELKVISDYLKDTK